MLRITPSHSAEGAARYYDAALGRSDYYGQQERGLWAGKGAEMLGLGGQVSREQFVALANNQRPDSKGRLTARTNGTRTETRRVFDPKTQPGKKRKSRYPIGGPDTTSVCRLPNPCRYTWR